MVAASCSQKKSSAELRVSSNFALGSDGFTGGLVVTGTSGTEKFTATTTTGTKISLTLNPGTWKFVVVGWDGSTPFSGVPYCGSKTEILGASDNAVEISATLANCGLTEFTSAGYVPTLSGSLKPLKIHTCASLVGSDLKPLTMSSSSGLFSSFCDDNSGLVTLQKQTAAGIKISIPSIDPMSAPLESVCLPTGNDPLTVGKLPLNGVPFGIRLFGTASCTDVGMNYFFKDGFLNALSDQTIVNTMPSTYNGLFLYYSSTGLPLNVVIKKAVSQSNPAYSSPIYFEAVFSRGIDPATFTSADISNSGTATSPSWSITNSGNNKTFFLTASSDYGTIIPAIPSGAVLDVSSSEGNAYSTGGAEVEFKAAIPFAHATSTYPTTKLGRSSAGVVFTLINSTGATFTGCSAPVLTGANASDFEIFSDDCGLSNLASSAMCDVIVRAKPTSAGTKTATLTRTCDGVYITTALNDLVVTADTALSWASPTTDFGKALIGKSSSVLEFFLRNESGVSLTGCGVAALSNTTDFSILTNNCTLSTMASMSSCSVKVKANPTSAVSVSGMLSRNCGADIATAYLQAAGESTLPDAIALGGDVSCIKKADGTAYCSGYGNWGQLTNGGRFSLYSPYMVALPVISSITVGSEHSCAIMPGDGSAKCWGQGPQGQLGDGSVAVQQTSPQPVSGLTNIRQLALGHHFSCALKNDYSVWCWGENINGVFGNGTGTGSNMPVAGASGPYEKLSAGDTSVCGLKSTGLVDCWGANESGQLGNGSLTNSSTPVAVTGISTATQLASGLGFHCALLSNGTIQCWGKNTNGQLGDSTTTNRNSPVTVPSLSNVTAIALGDGGHARHMCVIDSGVVKCWGMNNHNQLGTGVLAPSVSMPQAVSGVSGAIAIQRGNEHTCALLSNNSISCWGSNRDGQLGRGYSSPTPTQVTGLTNIVDVVLGENVTCALNTAGNVYCWGLNSNGQLGTGDTIDKITPTIVSGLTGITKIAGSGYIQSFSMCADNTSSVKCWGANDSGQLGLGNTNNQLTPVAISGLTSLLGGGSFHRCGVVNTLVSCSGQNAYGQLGNAGTTSSSTYLGSSILGGHVVNQISGNFGTTYGILDGGAAYSWGYGTLGNLGNGTTTSSTALTPIPSITSVTQILGSYLVACAVHNGGKVSCWGEGGPQLGIGGGSTQTTPQLLSSLDPVLQIAGGRSHVCALGVNGQVWCWGGQTQSGEVGDGAIIPRNLPTPVLNLSNVTKLWSGEGSSTHSCAIKADKTLWCWGMQESFTPSGFLPIEAVSGYVP
jgi:alpha-tubulin suppressor-like RCC1 family protein